VAWLDLAVVACSIVEFGRIVRFGFEGTRLVDWTMASPVLFDGSTTALVLVDLAVAFSVLVDGSGGFIVG